MLKPRLGVCSNWLASLIPQNKQVVNIWISRGTITFPKNDCPVIMVGPGIENKIKFFIFLFCVFFNKSDFLNNQLLFSKQTTFF